MVCINWSRLGTESNFFFFAPVRLSSQLLSSLLSLLWSEDFWFSFAKSFRIFSSAAKEKFDFQLKQLTVLELLYLSLNPFQRPFRNSRTFEFVYGTSSRSSSSDSQLQFPALFCARKERMSDWKSIDELQWTHLGILKRKQQQSSTMIHKMLNITIPMTCL